jgi:hypothetical protein
MYGQPTTIKKSPGDFSPGLCHSLPSRQHQHIERSFDLARSVKGPPVGPAGLRAKGS